MMGLVKNGQLVEDVFINTVDAEDVPAGVASIVSLEQWQAHRHWLIRQPHPAGVRLGSDQHPELISADVKHLAVVALEFPAFKDGRAYSYARLLRERYGFAGELRAVGDVLLEQLHFMQRVGFDAFEIDSEDPVRDFEIAASEFSAWYQPAGDGRLTAVQLRHAESEQEREDQRQTAAGTL